MKNIVICLFLTISSALMAQQVVTGRITNASDGTPVPGVSIFLRSYGLEKVEDNMTAQLEAYPQEKIHLHTDRDFYVPGEKIWFKAYVVDAATHLSSQTFSASSFYRERSEPLSPASSQYVYVELISPADTLASRVMIQQTDNMFYGHLPISEIIPEGNYTLRAYTRYMENLGDDYFFKKNIRIENLSSTKDQQQQTAQRSRGRRTPTEQEDFDISFFPEGGNLAEGVVCKIAFKALNRKGYSEPVSGYLIDETGHEISPVQTYHAGMGVFTYLPEPGKKYWLKCTNGSGLEKRFELPQSNPYAFSLAASMQNDRIRIGVQKSVNAPDMPWYLLVHSRGTVLYFSEWDKNQNTASLMIEDLPAGVLQFLLLDGQMNPLSERLVFSKTNASEKIEFQTDKGAYQNRDKITATLSFPDSLFFIPSPLERDGVRSHFSIAVTDDRDITVDESTTILSSLLLSSELKGYIENPAYYLQDPVAMDLLMMTHGWRRYNIPEVVQGHLESPQIPFQQYQEISGQVNTINLISRLKPAPDSEIIIVMKGGGFGAASTDGNGSFNVPNLSFPDSVTFYIQALAAKGSDNVQLTVENESFPALVYAPQSLLSRLKTKDTETKDESNINAFMVKAEQRSKFDEDIWTLHLKEVEVTAPIIRKKEPRDDFWLNSSSDYTLTREIIDEYKFPFIKNYLAMIPGLVSTVNSFGDFIFYLFRAPGIPPAKVYIDGVELDEAQDINHLPPTAIESIDVIKWATILGARGTGGVISITTRRGGDPGPEKFNRVVYNPLGYQIPVEFYSPNYETLEARQSAIPDYRTTIFWKPDVVISDDGEASFEFYTSDFPTTYSVVIEGITNDGKIIRQVEKIVVRD